METTECIQENHQEEAEEYSPIIRRRVPNWLKVIVWFVVFSLVFWSVAWFY